MPLFVFDVHTLRIRYLVSHLSPLLRCCHSLLLLKDENGFVAAAVVVHHLYLRRDKMCVMMGWFSKDLAI